MIEMISQPISREKLRTFLGQPFVEMVKFVVDIEKEVIALGGEMHADAEEVLLERGSVQKDLWGANVYPDLARSEQLQYESLINIRPSQGSRSIRIEDAGIRERMESIARRLLLAE